MNDVTPAEVVARYHVGDQITIELARHVMELPDKKPNRKIRSAAARYIALWEEAEAVIETATMPGKGLERRLDTALRRFDEEYATMEQGVLEAVKCRRQWVDELNRKRLEKGMPITTYGRTPEEMKAMAAFVFENAGREEHVYEAFTRNQATEYKESWWLPMGDTDLYEPLLNIPGLIGYRLAAVRKTKDGSRRYLYIAFGSGVTGIIRVEARSVTGVLEPPFEVEEELEDITEEDSLYAAIGTDLLKVVATSGGRIDFCFESHVVDDLEWDSPYKEHVEGQESDLLVFENDASKDVPLVAYLV